MPDFENTFEFEYKQSTMHHLQKSSDPKLLLLSGMHGDEYEIISCVLAYIKNHDAILDDYLFIPEVSPSAVAQRTRKNAWGHDTNRSFFVPAIDPEVAAFMKIVSDFHFDVCIDFHEDADRTKGCYLYDSDVFSAQQLTHLRAAITKTGASLYTGIDDPADANLGWHIRDGYISMPLKSIPPIAGFSGRWLLEKNIVKRAFTVEMPGQALPFLKQKLVEAIITALLPLVSHP